MKNMSPREQGPFWPQRYNLNKLGKSSPGDATYQISRLYALWFQTRRFFNGSPYISLCKTCDPPGGGYFWPLGHNLSKLDRGPLGDATYQISRLYALWFQTRRFFHVFTAACRRSFIALDLNYSPIRSIFKL